ncbi:hypothetical protein RIF29_06670 [Crotalaria pallida]|uniref:MACPF domain-containing protein n=1 Tax=Crotalaria pallida TaxID=3830 RepID=A0AAN9J3K9_CROPI
MEKGIQSSSEELGPLCRAEADPQNKPPIEELCQFLEFQLPRQWAPVYGELAFCPERKPKNTASLQFNFLAPKLYVNTAPVAAGKKLVTGLRLYLEGKKCNYLAIHLQHLSSLPKTFQLEDEPNVNISRLDDEQRRLYYKKVQLKVFSQVCTKPVESRYHNSVVTGAHFELEDAGLEKVLFLRLYFSKVAGATRVFAPEWVGSRGLISTRSALQKPPPPARATDTSINSALYPGRPPVSSQTPKLRIVETTEMSRGPEDFPGYWIVSGAKLDVENGKISLQVKYSLLSFNPDS